MTFPRLLALGVALFLAGYAFARDRVPVSDLQPGGDFLVPYWVELAVMTQLLVLLSHGVMVFWSSAFLRFQRADMPPSPAPLEPPPDLRLPGDQQHREDRNRQ